MYNIWQHNIAGISSSSPLSWHQDHHPPAEADETQLASQVRESLSNWSGHVSDDETVSAGGHSSGGGHGPGWATQVETELYTSGNSGQDSGVASDQSVSTATTGTSVNKKTEQFNFVEIVNFISNSWSNVSGDTNVQVFNGVGAN